MKFFKTVKAMKQIPRGYGLVHHYENRLEALIAPIPFNVILRLFYIVSCYLRDPSFGRYTELLKFYKDKCVRLEKELEKENLRYEKAVQLLTRTNSALEAKASE
jgi:hypothetical protein